MIHNEIPLLKIKYNDKPIPYGQHLTIDFTKAAPTVLFDFPKGSLYTTIMIDPDAPSPTDPNKRDFLHWLIVNNDDTIVSYYGPHPPEGLHRYYILIFEQKSTFDSKTMRQNINDHTRRNFDTNKFIDQYLVLPPIAKMKFLVEKS